MGKVADIAGDNREAVQKSDGGNAKVLAADTDALPLQLPKDSVNFLVVGQESPLAEVVNSLDESRMSLG